MTVARQEFAIAQMVAKRRENIDVIQAVKNVDSDVISEYSFSADIRSHQRQTTVIAQNRMVKMENRMIQWRLFFHFEKLLQVNKDILYSGKLPIYLQFCIGDQISKLQISDNRGQVKLQNEKVV